MLKQLVIEIAGFIFILYVIINVFGIIGLLGELLDEAIRWIFKTITKLYEAIRLRYRQRHY